MCLEDESMIRIRGCIGDWPVDLQVEMDDSDWARLANHLPSQGEPTATVTAERGDGLWRIVLELLRKAERMDGPQLLAELQALAGSAEAGKRLLVRLRHCEQVRVESGADAPVYCWVGERSAAS
jgi:hypothetical protein